MDILISRPGMVYNNMTFLYKGFTMATIKQATSAILDAVVLTAIAPKAIVVSIAKPLGNVAIATDNYSKILVEDSVLSLEETKLQNSAKLAGLKTLSKDDVYLAEVKAKYIAELKGDTEISF